MSFIATMGTNSCATIAIGGFKSGQMEANEKYKADPKSYEEPKDEGLSVDQFYSQILYPITQPLGRTRDLPFEYLMKRLAKTSMADKFTIATLNIDQYDNKDGYWANELKRWGFKLIDKTKNNIGSMCYIFVRNEARRDMDADDKEYM